MNKNSNPQNSVGYVVRAVSPEAPGVTTLHLTLANGSIPAYVPGQYITVYAPHLGTPEGKAYSASSSPEEATLNITVKDIGKFSHYLSTRKAGDEIAGSLPYGYFYSESDTTPLVMVAAGIGISPFRGMILHSVRKNQKRELFLFCSNRTTEDIVFKKELDELVAEYKNLHIKHCITRGEAGPDMMRSRITARYILDALGKTKNPEFLLCGSISFVRDLWRDLKANSVPEECVYTEAFFSH